MPRRKWCDILQQYRISPRQHAFVTTLLKIRESNYGQVVAVSIGINIDETECRRLNPTVFSALGGVPPNIEPKPKPKSCFEEIQLGEFVGVGSRFVCLCKHLVHNLLQAYRGVGGEYIPRIS